MRKNWTIEELKSIPIKHIFSLGAPAQWNCEANLTDEDGDPAENLQTLQLLPNLSLIHPVWVKLNGLVEDLPGLQEVSVLLGPEQQLSVALSLLQNNDVDVAGLLQVLTEPRNQIFTEISRERNRQLAKWGEQSHHRFAWSAILTEECGEVAQETLRGPLDAPDCQNPDALEKELIQTAAVCVAWLEHLQRQKQARHSDQAAAPSTDGA